VGGGGDSFKGRILRGTWEGGLVALERLGWEGERRGTTGEKKKRAWWGGKGLIKRGGHLSLGWEL